MKIRKASENDLPELFKLIQKFAEYLGKGDFVKCTIEDFQKLQDHFICFLAEADNHEIVGYALCFYSFHTWTGKAIYLDDLFVKEEYRGNSIGKLLIDKLVSFAKENNCTKVEWEVLNWNTKAINFYKKLAAIVGDDNLNCYLEIK